MTVRISEDADDMRTGSYAIIRKAEENLFLAFQKKAQVALGSDAGATW